MPDTASNKKKPETNDADGLSGLLDEALGDFNRISKQQPRCSDDDLDDFLAPMDAKASKFKHLS